MNPGKLVEVLSKCFILVLIPKVNPKIAATRLIRWSPGTLTLIDLFRCKPISDQLITILKQHFHTLVFDEQYENFNLSTMLLKFVNNHSLNNNIVPSALKEYIDFGNDGRENILDRNNLSTLKIIDKINKYLWLIFYLSHQIQVVAKPI